ncbi:uncharacterized protein LOC119078581 [Bradysia coprophila]|uniref:uncharacterized protein LOC119078581 n=1 Tax=Bradysia coprophila TaxID=38358 RepID=UPI00187D87B3|nr:uncharacterized protein LOC119078581 [Bradysia coprophila]
MMFIVFLTLSALLYSTSGTSERLFSSDFRAPNPPAVLAEYQASFVQHKWDASGISHIVSGTIYANLRRQRLRMDITYDGVIASSLFDYENANIDGTVPNYIYTLSPTIASPGVCAQYNVTPAYPLFPPNILIDSDAAFTGLATDNLFYSDQQPLWSWGLSIGGVSVTVFLDRNNTAVRIDFSAPGGTFTTTRLFNIIAGSPNDTLFEYPCRLDDIR